MMPDVARNLAIAIVAVLAAATAITACGGGSGSASTSARTGPGERLPLGAEETRVEQQRLVTDNTLLEARPGSAERAFYGYWSALENEEWSIAIDYYPRDVQLRLKPDALVVALRIEAQSPPLKPLIRSVRAARDNQTSIRYFLRGSNGKLRSTSITLRSRAGRWYIAYSSTLDDSYGAAAQLLVQSLSDPRARVASKQALAAGARARRAQAAAALAP